MKKLGAGVSKGKPIPKFVYIYWHLPANTYDGLETLLGVHDPAISKLARYKQSRTGRTGSNAARDFHRFIHRNGMALPVEISTTKIPIRKKVRKSSGRRRTQESVRSHPIIYLSSWLKIILEKYPRFLLGGYCPFQDRDAALDMFENFWANFKHVDPEHPVHQKPLEQRRRTIPIALHGDEGRGLAKVPLLVISFQAIIPFSGPNQLNCSKFLGSHLSKFGDVGPKCHRYNWVWGVLFCIHVVSQHELSRICQGLLCYAVDL